jgi:hypothetical protein
MTWSMVGAMQASHGDLRAQSIPTPVLDRIASGCVDLIAAPSTRAET